LINTVIILAVGLGTVLLQLKKLQKRWCHYFLELVAK